ncbi:hypothetical protein L218DRAFT_1002912 [Marasmius fiardii PR-910]|nr:hypothetical protein L218DRAFT_1002912 [Marasmius fiardii PR-910]
MAFTLQIAELLALSYITEKAHTIYLPEVFHDNIIFLQNATQVCLVIASALTDGILVRSQSLLHSKSKASIRYGDATSSGTGDTC